MMRKIRGRDRSRRVTRLMLCAVAALVAVAVIASGAFDICKLFSVSQAYAVDKSITGYCTIRGTDPGADAGGDCAHAEFDVTMPDGEVIHAYCIDHGAYMPANGRYRFTGTWNGSSYDIVVESRYWADSMDEIGELMRPAVDPSLGVSNWTQRVGDFTWSPTGTLSLQKASENPAMTDGNRAYSLAGAVYGIYSDRACETKVGEMSTDAEGAAKSGELMAGTYYVKEVSPSPGYGADNTVYQAEVVSGENVAVNDGSPVLEPPLGDLVPLCLQKVDAQTGEPKPQGAASLEGAQYTFWFFAGDFYSVAEDGSVTDEAGSVIVSADGAFGSDSPERTWVVSTDGDGVASLSDGRLVHEASDSLYYDADGDVALPLGTVVVRETKAPAGYLLSQEVFAMRVIEGENHQANVTGDTTLVDGSRYIGDSGGVCREQVVRGDIELSKVEGLTMGRLSGVPFMVTSKTTGEQHVVVTDENGCVNTSAQYVSHELRTNANDAAVSLSGGAWQVDEGLLDSTAGIWFAGLDEGGAEPDDAYGALPYDAYRFEELPVAANEGHHLVAFDIELTRDGYVVDLGTIDDNAINLDTVASASDGGRVLGVGKTVELIDTVEYEGLSVGDSYTLRATVVDTATGELLLDNAETPVVGITEFTPGAISGTQTVSLTLDTTELAGHELVVFEELYNGSGDLIESHEDIDDEDQTVTVAQPSIATKLTDAEEGDHELLPTAGARLIDVVSYQGLTPGASYVIEGVLMDQATGEPALIDGEQVVGSTAFVPDDEAGTVGVPFELDAAALEPGTNVVAFETLYLNDVEIANHSDIHDLDQTVEVTQAPDGQVFDKTGFDRSLAVGIISVMAVSIIGLVAYGLHQLRVSRKAHEG